jgi:NADH:ubiquinone oxidoreductase subunit H
VSHSDTFRKEGDGWYQRRRGPSVVGIMGLLQPFADGLKPFIKEIFTSKSNKIYSYLPQYYF